MNVTAYGDSSDLLADDAPYRFDFYVLDLMLPGVAGTELLRIIRKRTQAGVLIVSGRLGPEVFAEVINAGADMYLTKPVTFEQVELAVRAVHRRIMTTARTATAWKLDSRRSLLTAPDGQSVELGVTDLILMECFCRPGATPSAGTTFAACWPIPAQPNPTTACTPPSTGCAAASKRQPLWSCRCSHSRRWATSSALR